MVTMSAKSTKVTAVMIREAIGKRWSAPEYAVMFEVGNATGSRVRRHADAVIMSLWPSRGLELHGVEIKVSRSDWKREAADPTKAEEVAQYCDRWWVITAPGVIDDLSDVPPAWGVREFDGRRWETLREASLTKAEPVSREFLGGMLRRADVTMREDIKQAAATALEAATAEIDKRVEIEVAARTRSSAALHEVAAEIRKEFGVDLGNWSDKRDFVAAFRLGWALVRSGLGGCDYSGVDAYLKFAGEGIEKARRAVAGLAKNDFELPRLRSSTKGE